MQNTRDLMTVVLAEVMTNCISANTEARQSQRMGLIARFKRQDGFDNHPKDRGDFPVYRLGDVLSPRMHMMLGLPM